MKRKMAVAPELLCLVNSDYRSESNTLIDITEIQTDGRGRGAGRIRFAVSSPCVAVRLPGQPIKWLTNQKCGDAVIFQFTGDDVHLHVVELKSKMTAGEWIKTKEQVEGAYLNAVAIRSIWELPEFLSVSVHVAYGDDGLVPDRITTPSVLKPGLGSRSSVSVADWLSDRIYLGIIGHAHLLRIKRGSDGNAELALPEPSTPPLLCEGDPQELKQ